MAFVIERNGKFLVRQRPAGVVNAHLWEFPNVEIYGSKLCAEEIFKTEFGVAAAEISPLKTVKHSITRYRITLEAFKLKVGKEAFPKKTGVWKTPAQMEALAFTSAHRLVARASRP
jgi:adenine-specific DNA glycosylase